MEAVACHPPESKAAAVAPRMAVVSRSRLQRTSERMSYDCGYAGFTVPLSEALLGAIMSKRVRRVNHVH